MDTHQPQTTRLSYRQIAPTFAAEVEGMPIHGDVTPELLSHFTSLLHRFRVLVVPAVELEPADLVAFSRRFGPLEVHSRIENTLPSHREVFCVGNVEQDGMKASFSRGVEQWHADSSYREQPSDASLFYGLVVPPEGGDTLFCDATAAYRTLDPKVRARIDGLYALHSLKTLRQWGQTQNPDRTPTQPGHLNRFPPARQALVRKHPVTGSKSLYVCPAVISQIEGLEDAEAQSLLHDLITHATQERFVYRHKWRQGDLVMWDNRAVLHTASLFDHTRYQRLMYRTTLAAGAPLLMT